MTPTSQAAKLPTTKSASARVAAEPLAVLAARAACALDRSIQRLVPASDHNLGHLETQAAHDVRELLRQAVERGAQAKADATPPRCPACGQPLSRRSCGHARTFECRFGSLTVQRARGYCKHCQKWRTPADAALGLADTAGYSPAVPDLAALLASKMPVADASAVLEHLTGVQLPRATLDREAKRQGERAQRLRTEMDQPAATEKRPLELTLEPYQMIIQLDAWHIRERDAWGKSAARRRRGEPPARWPQARQRLDFYHAVPHLVAVGRALFGEDQDQFKAWLKPLVRQLKHESAVKVIRQLEEALAGLPGGAQATAVAKEVDYFREHEARMDYRAGRRAGEPIGSGPVEAMCRQYQCRFKRPGQFWSQRGDEALMCLETFWRNDRWHLLFPHSSFNPAKNWDAPRNASTRPPLGLPTSAVPHTTPARSKHLKPNAQLAGSLPRGSAPQPSALTT